MVNIVNFPQFKLSYQQQQKYFGYERPVIKLMRLLDGQPTFFAVPILQWQRATHKKGYAATGPEHLQLAPNIHSIHRVFGAHYAVELKPQAWSVSKPQ